MKSALAHRVAVVVCDGIGPFHLSVPCMVFGDDLPRLDMPRYDLVVCAENAGSMTTLSGFSIDVPCDLSALETADTVIVPAWLDAELRPSAALIAALRAAPASSACVSTPSCWPKLACSTDEPLPPIGSGPMTSRANIRTSSSTATCSTSTMAAS